MEQIRGHFEVVSLTEASRLLSTGAVDRPLAVITFDDGFLNFYTCAFPILRELSLPSTLFVSTGFVGTDDMLWFCRLNLEIGRTSVPTLSWRGETFKLDSEWSRSLAAEKIQQGLKALDHDTLLNELQAIIRSLGGNPDEPAPSQSPYRMLNRAQLCELHESGLVELGAHTVSHAILNRLGRERRQWEIRQSVADIAAITGSPCTLFAYPNGELDDYGETDIDTAAQCGITTAVSNHLGVAVNRSHSLELRRLPIGSNITRQAFLALFGRHDAVLSTAAPAADRRSPRPSHIRLDVASACQLRCPCCVDVRQSGDYTVADGWLSFEQFKKLLDHNPWVSRIEISNWGEIFLNPELVEILRYARENGVSLSAANGVNLNHARDDMLEALVKYQLLEMTCSIDGASDAIYRQYRVRGDLERVLRNIERINYYKDLYQSEYPRLSWQFVVFGHNQHEIETARLMAKRLDMKFKLKLSWDPDYSAPQQDDILAREFGPAVTSVRDYRDVNDREYLQETMCSQLWVEPVVNWDGVLYGCCANYWQPFELNAFTDGLDAAINSPKMNYARAMLTGEKSAVVGIPCTTCRQYKTMQASGKFMDAPRVPVGQRALVPSELSPAAAVPDVSFTWWRWVWRHYTTGDSDSAVQGLRRFCDQNEVSLAAVAKRGILDTPTEQMLPAIERFVRDVAGDITLDTQGREMPVALYLTAFGQAALRGERTTAWRAFRQALRHSLQPAAFRAWWQFCHAALLHARNTHTTVRRTPP